MPRRQLPGDVHVVERIRVGGVREPRDEREPPHQGQQVQGDRDLHGRCSLAPGPGPPRGTNRLPRSANGGAGQRGPSSRARRVRGVSPLPGLRPRPIHGRDVGPATCARASRPADLWGQRVKRRVRGPMPWLLVGVIGGLGCCGGVSLWGQRPPRAASTYPPIEGPGVIAGQSPYARRCWRVPRPVRGPVRTRTRPRLPRPSPLFAGLPDGIALVLWGLGATAGLALAAWQSGGHRVDRGPDCGTDGGPRAARPGVRGGGVFGNLDAGTARCTGHSCSDPAGGLTGHARRGRHRRRDISVAKLHPASLLAWIAARALLDIAVPRDGCWARRLSRGPQSSSRAWPSVVWPLAGLRDVVRVGAGADMVDPGTSPLCRWWPGSPPGRRGPPARCRRGSPSRRWLPACRGHAGTRPHRQPRDRHRSLPHNAARHVDPLPGRTDPGRHRRRDPFARLASMVVLAVVLADLAIAFGPLLWVGVAVLLFAAYREPTGYQ